MNNKDMKLIIALGIIATIILSVICLFFSKVCALLCFLLGASLTVLFTIVVHKRNTRLNELNDYLSLVCSGHYELDVFDNTEGELSILKNNIYKVVTILRTQNEMLRKDRLYLADSLADISHQLKTPLTSMMVMTDLLKDEQSEEKKTEFISVIENQLDKMKWLITNLLKLSKLDAGTVEFRKESFLSIELIEEAVMPFALSLDIKGIGFENDIEEFSILGDKAWTIEAVQNIIKNCIEHTERDGKITISSKRTNLFDEVRISDNGIGISEADLPHIFERFYHGKNSSKDSVGIGLALAKTVLEKENGTITAQSLEGEGTEFIIRFYKSIV